MTRVDNFLNTLRSDGQEDSSGTFSIDPNRALEKLAKFQLSGPGWIPLKLVQAAVSIGAPFVLIFLRRNDLTVAFPFPKGRGLESFSFDKADDQPWQRHLKIALRASNQCQDWSLRILGEHRSTRIEYDGAEIYQTDTEQAQHSTWTSFYELVHDEFRELLTKQPYQNLALFKLTRATKWWRNLLRLPAKEHAELCSRLEFCPIPVFLDRFLLNKPWKSDKLAAKCYTLTSSANNALLASPSDTVTTRVYRLPWRMVDLEGVYSECIMTRWRGVEKKPGGGFLPPEQKLPVKKNSYVVTPENSTFSLPAKGPKWRWHARGELHGWLCSQFIQVLPTSRKGPYLIPVVHGVSLDTEMLPSTLPHGTIVASVAEHLKVDLSESKLIKNEALDEFVRGINKDCETLLSDARAAENLYT